MAHAGKSEDPIELSLSNSVEDRSQQKEEAGDKDSVKTNNKKVRVCICSVSNPSTVDGLKHDIKALMKDEVESVFFKQLPYNIRDMITIDLSDVDVLLLCHSINNRRFSITDVTDALYDEFLKRAESVLGKSKVGVIAYDFRSEDLGGSRLDDRMDAFRRNQSSTFKFSSLALIGAQLSTSPVELTSNQLDEMRGFLGNASDPPLEERLRVMLRKFFSTLCCQTQ